MVTTRVKLAVAATILMAASAVLADRAQAGPQAVAARPKLVIAEPSKDVGDLVTGTVVEHSFVLRNEGAAPLEVRELQPGMGPVLITHFDRVIPPGATGRIDLRFDSIMAFGPGTTKILVLTNDTDQPKATVELKWKVEPVVTAKPGFSRWQYVQDEPTGMIPHRVSARDGQPFALLGVDTPVPHIHASFRQLGDDERDPQVEGSQWQVELTVDPKSPPGPISGLVVVRTDHPRQSRMPISVSGFVRPRFILEPEWGKSADLGTLQLDTPATFTFKLRNFSTAPVEVAMAETTVAGVTASSAPAQFDAARKAVSGVGHFYDITVRLDPETMTAGPFQGKLVVRVSDPHQPIVEMPFSGVLVKG